MLTILFFCSLGTFYRCFLFWEALNFIRSMGRCLTVIVGTIARFIHHYNNLFRLIFEFDDNFVGFPSSCRCQGSYTPQGGPPSYPRTQESMAIPSVGSPPSAAPSPLPNPHSQPASVPPGDQVMPTLSPHPPTVTPSPLEKTHTPEQPAAGRTFTHLRQNGLFPWVFYRKRSKQPPGKRLNGHQSHRDGHYNH